MFSRNASPHRRILSLFLYFSVLHFFIALSLLVPAYALVVAPRLLAGAASLPTTTLSYHRDELDPRLRLDA